MSSNEETWVSPHPDTKIFNEIERKIRRLGLLLSGTKIVIRPTNYKSENVSHEICLGGGPPILMDTEEECKIFAKEIFAVLSPLQQKWAKETKNFIYEIKGEI